MQQYQKGQSISTYALEEQFAENQCTASVKNISPNSPRPTFYYKGILIDEDTPRDQLNSVAKRLGLLQINRRSNLSLCQAIYNILLTTGRFWNEKFVQSVHRQPFQCVGEETILEEGQEEQSHHTFAIQSENEGETVAPTDGSEEFVWPANVDAWQAPGQSQRNLTQKQKAVWAQYISQLKTVLFYSPDIQITGKRDVIKNIKPVSTTAIESVLWNDCLSIGPNKEISEEIDDIFHDKKKLEERHKELKRQGKRVPRISFYSGMSSKNKFRQLVKLVARSTRQDFLEIQDLLASLASEGIDLNQRVPSGTLDTPGIRCAQYAGKTLIQIAILCPNHFQEGVDAFLTIRELLRAHTRYNLPEVDLNQTDDKGDTALLIGLRRCASLQNEVTIIRETNNDPRTESKYRIPEDSLDTMVIRAYQSLHDIILLFLRPSQSYEQKYGSGVYFEHLPINVNKDNKGVTPLHVAVRSGCLRCLRFLQRHAKNLDATIRDEETGRTALHDAVRLDNPLMVYYLLQEKINLRSIDKSFSTVFHIAARHGFDTGYERHQRQKEVVAALWAQKDNEKKGSSASRLSPWTVRENAPSIFEMLWNALKLSIKGMQQKTSDEQAKEKQYVQSLSAFEKNERKTREYNEKTRPMKNIIDAKDINKLTALMISSLKRDKNGVYFLIFECNANALIEQDTIGATALSMLEYDLIPEIEEDKDKDRKEIVEILRSAEESLRRKKKARRLAKNEPLISSTILGTPSTGAALPPALVKGLERFNALKPFESQIILLNEALKTIFDTHNLNVLTEIKVKYIDRFLTPEGCVVAAISPDERKSYVSKRYRIAAFYGLTDFETKLFDLEEKIKQSGIEGSDDMNTICFQLFTFIEQYMLRNVYAEKNFMTEPNKMFSF